jgi:hypothetical protein
MNSKIFFVSLIYTLAVSFCQGQKIDLLRVTSSKISEDSVSRYKIVIENYSDSIVVLIHSVFFDIDELTDEPLGLALYGASRGVNFYSLTHAWRDSKSAPQHYPLSVNYILPRQKLEFKIATKPVCQQCALIIDYFHVYDFDYRTFLGSIDHYWDHKYNVKSVTTTLEK